MSSSAHEITVRGQSVQLPEQGWAARCPGGVGSARTCLCPAEPPALVLGAGQSEPWGGWELSPAHLPLGWGSVRGHIRTGSEGAQQGQHRLFLVPVLGFLHSSICISFITLLFGHLGLIPVIVLGVHCLTGFCECSEK